MSAVRVGSRVRVVRGVMTGKEGVVAEIKRRIIAVRVDTGWPFPVLVEFGRDDLTLVDPRADAEDALL